MSISFIELENLLPAQAIAAKKLTINQSHLIRVSHTDVVSRTTQRQKSKVM